MANEWDELTQNAFNFIVGTASFVAEETDKALRDISERTQAFVDDAIARGETQYEQWVEEGEKGGSVKSDDTPSLGLYSKLLRCVNHDRALANRLLNSTIDKYPEESYDWCCEKVIYDLERDRNRA